MHGTTCTSLHKHPHPSPSKLPDAYKTMKLAPKYRAEQFPNHFYATSDVPLWKFRQREWKNVDVCKLKVKCANTALHTRPKGRIECIGRFAFLLLFPSCTRTQSADQSLSAPLEVSACFDFTTDGAVKLTETVRARVCVSVPPVCPLQRSV